MTGRPGASAQAPFHGKLATPSDSDALAALRVLRSWLGLGVMAAPAVFTGSQLPPEVASADAFARIHRPRMRAGVGGWSKCGSVRSVTAAAWSDYVAEQTRTARTRAKRVAPFVPRDLKPANDGADAELDRALGVRRR